MNKYTYRPPCSESDLREMYETKQMSQIEIAQHLSVSQKVIFTAMRRFGIISRSTAVRNQIGTANKSWKGDRAGYQALHLRIQSQRGKPQHCEQCGTTDPSKTYDWSNKTGNYADPMDYWRLCRSCHSKFDDKIRNITGKISS